MGLGRIPEQAHGRVRLVALLAAWCLACSTGAPRAQVADTTASVRCASRNDGASGLADEWKPFARHIQSCRVGTGPGSLEIISVSATAFYRDQPSGATTTALPKPIMRLGAKDVGRL